MMAAAAIAAAGPIPHDREAAVSGVVEAPESIAMGEVQLLNAGEASAPESQFTDIEQVAAAEAGAAPEAAAAPGAVTEFEGATETAALVTEDVAMEPPAQPTVAAAAPPMPRPLGVVKIKPGMVPAAVRIQRQPLLKPKSVISKQATISRAATAQPAAHRPVVVVSSAPPVTAAVSAPVAEAGAGDAYADFMSSLEGLI